MTRVRMKSRMMSIVVVLALVAVAAIGLPCVAVGLPMTGGTSLGHGACAVDDHGAPTAVAISADDSHRVVRLVASGPPAGIGSHVPTVRAGLASTIWTEMPPSADPRHGRTTV